MSGKTTAIVIGALFLIAGILGFVPNSVIGTTAFSVGGSAMATVRVVGGILLLIVGSRSASRPRVWLAVFAALYVLGTLYLYVVTSSVSLALGNWVHLGLGLLLIIGALIAQQSPRAA
jgi:uncharacterized membrane protein HdeD (DUF308 family)